MIHGTVNTCCEQAHVKPLRALTVHGVHAQATSTEVERSDASVDATRDNFVASTLYGADTITEPFHDLDRGSVERPAVPSSQRLVIRACATAARMRPQNTHGRERSVRYQRIVPVTSTVDSGLNPTALTRCGETLHHRSHNRPRPPKCCDKTHPFVAIELANHLPRRYVPQESTLVTAARREFGIVVGAAAAGTMCEQHITRCKPRRSDVHRQIVNSMTVYSIV